MGYYVRALLWKKSSPLWKLQFVSYKKCHAAASSAVKPKKEWDIPPRQWATLGFTPSMDIKCARTRASQLNAQVKIKADEERRCQVDHAAGLFERETQAKFPDLFKREFETRFIIGRAERAHCRGAMAHWRGAQKAIMNLRIEPSAWHDGVYDIYDYFCHRRYSLSYTGKILRFMNLWGFFICRKLGFPFLPVARPRGYERRRILDAYYAKRKTRNSGSLPLKPGQLESKKLNLKPEQYNWLYLSVWLGLCPIEVDQMKDKCNVTIEKMPDGISVLWIYQTKLVSIPPHHRWKPIPLIMPEQQCIPGLVRRGEFVRPLVKTLRAHFGLQTTLYGGRKGFTDLMLARGQSLENISQWMGHSSIERTWRHYKDRLVVHYRNYSETESS